MVTTDLGLPVASSTVFHRPTGESMDFSAPAAALSRGAQADPSKTERARPKTNGDLMECLMSFGYLDRMTGGCVVCAFKNRHADFAFRNHKWASLLKASTAEERHQRPRIRLR